MKSLFFMSIGFFGLFLACGENPEKEVQGIEVTDDFVTEMKGSYEAEGLRIDILKDKSIRITENSDAFTAHLEKEDVFNRIRVDAINETKTMDQLVLPDDFSENIQFHCVIEQKGKIQQVWQLPLVDKELFAWHIKDKVAALNKVEYLLYTSLDESIVAQSGSFQFERPQAIEAIEVRTPDPDQELLEQVNSELKKALDSICLKAFQYSSTWDYLSYGLAFHYGDDLKISSAGKNIADSSEENKNLKEEKLTKIKD